MFKDPFKVELEKKIIWVTISRFFLLAILVISTLLNYWKDLSQTIPWIIIISTSVVTLINFFTFILIKRKVSLELIGYFQLITDIVLWSIIVLLTGGSISIFSIFYILTIITASFLFAKKGAINFALASFIFFSIDSFTSFQYPELLRTITNDEIIIIKLNLSEVLSYLLLNFVAFIITGGVSGYLAERERKAGGSLIRLEQLSAELAALNQYILKSIPAGLITTDPEGNITYINPKGASLLKYDERELYRKKIKELFPTLTLSYLSYSKENNNSIRGEEITLKDKLGNKITLILRIADLRDQIGNFKGKLITFEDVTTIKKLEEELNRSKKLVSLGEISASIAHEIKNPLGSIYGCLQIIKQNEQRKEIREIIEIALEEIERLTLLINNMLELIRKREPKPKPSDIISIVNKIIKLITHSYKEAPKLTVEAPNSLILIVDPYMIEQVLWNLILNGINVTPQDKEVKIRIFKNSDFSFIEIIDQGPGIPEDNLKNIFEPFNSLRQGGFGLGLAVSKQIVELHGGEITLSNLDKGGLKVTLKLPLNQQSLDENNY